MEKREQVLLILAGFMGVVVGVYYYFWPMWNQYNRWNQTIQDNIKQIRTAQRTANKISKMVEDLTQMKRKLKQSRKKLPEESKFNELMSRLEQEAKNAGISDKKIVSINQGSTRERDLIKEMTIRARLDRITMEQMSRMLWRFDNSIEMVDIKSFDEFSLNRVENEEGFRYNLDLQIVVYIMKDDKKPSSGEA